MPIDIGGTAQTAQEQRELDDLQNAADRFARTMRKALDDYEELERIYSALGYGPDIGLASADEYVTASSSSRDVESLRAIIKAAVSYAVSVGELTQAEGEVVIQQAYGNDTESTVDASGVDDLAGQWV